MYKSLIKSNIKNQTDIYRAEMEKAYIKIDERWLKFHFNITIGLAVFALLIESILGVIIIKSELLSTTIPIYFLKFLIIPSGLNFITLVIIRKILKSERTSTKTKMTSVSIGLVLICFVLFTVHSAFAVTYYVFTVAIMMTSVYADYRLTNITSLISVILVITSELFIKWDFDKISIYESTFKLSEFIISIFSLIAFSIVCMVVIRFEREKKEASIKVELERFRLEKSLQIDELTGIYNKKALLKALDNIEKKNTDSVILVIVDIDNFKAINDTWGHHLGDRCLTEFASILRDNNDKFTSYRFGGDEFCLLFNSSKIKDVFIVCERIKNKIEEIKFKEQPNLIVTASFGIAEYDKHMSGTELFINADKALYKAKEKRNKICVYK